MTFKQIQETFLSQLWYQNEAAVTFGVKLSSPAAEKANFFLAVTTEQAVSQPPLKENKLILCFSLGPYHLKMRPGSASWRKAQMKEMAFHTQASILIKSCSHQPQLEQFKRNNLAFLIK